MNAVDVVAFGFILTGVIGLLFVVYVVIYNKLLAQYHIHYEDMEGNHSYAVVNACSKYGAVKKAANTKYEMYRITGVVRYRGE